MRNKRGEGYVRTCIMILIFCIGIAAFMSFVTAVNIIRISKRNTYKVIDGFVTLNSIDAYNSIKVGTDTLDSMDTDVFTDYFCEYNGLEQNGSILIAKTADGNEKYRISGLDLTYIEEKTLKMQVQYLITVPISFGDFTVMNAQVPVTIKSKLTDKFS